MTINLPRPAIQATRYGCVGVINTLVDMGIFIVLLEYLQMPAAAANVIAFSCGAVNSFVLNRYWTFSGERRKRMVSFEAAGFMVVTVFGLALSTGIVVALSDPIGPIAAKAVSVPVTFAATFLINKKAVFRA